MTPGAKPPVHVIFAASAAGSVRQALNEMGCREAVIGLLDDLSYGPIDPSSNPARREWMGRSLGEGYREVVQRADLFFWPEATSPIALPLAWFSRRRASEYAGFLEFVWRMEDSSYRIVDVTDVELDAPKSAGAKIILSALSLLAPRQVIEARPLDRQRAPEPDEVEHYRALWRKLRAENAPLRVVDKNGLASAPINHFDDVIVSCASGEWRKGAFVVGSTIMTLLETPMPQSPGDAMLWTRVCALADAGILEIKGDGSSMRDTLVRQRQKRRV